MLFADSCYYDIKSVVIIWGRSSAKIPRSFCLTHLVNYLKLYFPEIQALLYMIAWKQSKNIDQWVAKLQQKHKKKKMLRKEERK